MTDGEVEEAGDALIVKNAKELTLDYDIRTSFNGYDKHPVLEGISPVPLLEKILPARRNPMRLFGPSIWWSMRPTMTASAFLSARKRRTGIFASA